MKKTTALLFSIVFIFSFSLKAQEDSTKVLSYLDRQGTFDELSLIAGYSFNGGNEKGGPDNHIIELGIYKSRNSYYVETAGYSYFLSNEFMFNKNSFYLGPKIGSFFHVWMFYLGSELVYYTNFKGQALHIVPIFGLGYSKFKIGIGLHIPLANNLFEHTNIPSIGFTYEIKNLQKRKIDY
ncbi:hypothetical protein [uncultured Proteiniphilum sp.]|uniref:hypothetical protein n=1 Tax=uncultured Proteiniphilum sp. TaxID=497637 RepID=UPI00260FD6CF|nr:hypothetical protein [uncultured Proteiniphilum sp.]